MAGPVRGYGSALLEPERLGDVAVEPEAVGLQVRAVRRRREQVHGDVVRAVGRHGQVEGLGEVADLNEHRHPAAVRHVGLGKGDAARLDQGAELVQRMEILAGGDGQAALAHHAHVAGHVVGDDRLLQPHQVEVAQGAGGADGLVHAPAHVGVHHEREAGAEVITHRPHTLHVLV